MSLDAGRFLLVTKVEYLQTQIPAMLDTDSKKCINKCCSIWFKEDAETDAVLFFLNKFEAEFKCDSFLPIFYNEAGVLGCKITEGDIDRVKCLTPIVLQLNNAATVSDVEFVIDMAFKDGNWQRDYGFGIKNTEDNDMEIIDISPYAKKPISQATIDFRLKQLEIYKRKAALDKKFLPWVNEAVKGIELARRRLDVETGFRDLQLNAHDVAIKLPETEGLSALNFDVEYIGPIFAFFKSCLDNIIPSTRSDCTLAVSSMAYGSSVLLLDFVQTSRDFPDAEKETVGIAINKVKQTVKGILSAAPDILDSSKSVERRIEDFLTKTKIEPKKAASIIEKMEKLFPTRSDRYNSASIIFKEDDSENVNNEKGLELKFEKEKLLSFTNVKRTIKDQVKEIPEVIIGGYLGAVVVWDEKKPKFAVKTETETGNRVTINYEYNKVNNDKVKSLIGKTIKLERVKHGRSWYLVRWIED